MPELFVAASTSNEGNPQFRVAYVQGEETQLTDDMAANTIAAELRVTGVHDREALAMMRLYAGHPVEPELYSGLDGLASKRYAANMLTAAIKRDLSDQKLDYIDPNGRYEIVSELINGQLKIDRSYVTFIGEDNLSKNWLAGDAVTATTTEPYEQVTHDEIVAKVAEIHGLPMMGFAYEVVSKDSDVFGTVPELLSLRCHYALGKLSVDGAFEHVLTVLDENHPVRAAIANE